MIGPGGLQKLALHQNGVEFRQQFNGAIRSSLAALYDDVQCLATNTYRHRDKSTMRINVG